MIIKRLCLRPLSQAVRVIRARAIADYLISILKAHDGNIAAAARHAEMSRTYFVELLQRYEVRAADYRRHSMRARM